MRKNALTLYLAIVFGLVFPALVFSRIESKYPVERDGSSETTMPTQEIVPKISIKNGDTIMEMDMESYVLGVVLQEMPVSFDVEALKAQAVVARTYASRRLGMDRHFGADICTEPSCCQGYCDPEDYAQKGLSSESVDKVRQAVSETEGMVLLYKGELIEATYFSCSGGLTEDAQAVWGTDVPYLQSTESPGEENALHYTDTVRISVRELQEKLNITLQQSDNFKIGGASYTDGGGIKTIVIGGQEFTGIEIRSALGLRSTAFVMTAIGDTVTITTKGYGHRVGMSQYGAEAMAVNGSDYREILMHYYIGTELSKVL